MEVLKVSSKTIIETIEHKIKTDPNLLYWFVKSDIRVSTEYLSFHQYDRESELGYSLFKLYCFYNYSLDKIFNLLKELSNKYIKSDLKRLTYSDFLTYTHRMMFNERKKEYKKTSPEYQNNIQLKEDVESENIKHLISDYADTINIINLLKSEIKFYCNNEDVPSEKKFEYINKYSKTYNRLNETKSDLLEKIRAEKL